MLNICARSALKLARYLANTSTNTSPACFPKDGQGCVDAHISRGHSALPHGREPVLVTTVWNNFCSVGLLVLCYGAGGGVLDSASEKLNPVP